MNDLRDGLKAEICFWQELMHNSELEPASQAYQRMEKALALARLRLAETERWLLAAESDWVEH